MPRWTIPRIWEGETSVIIGGGPSAATVNFDLIKHLKVISINDAYKDQDTYEPRTWIDCAYWKDCGWYDKQYAFAEQEDLGTNRMFLTRFKGLKVTSCEDYMGDPDVKVLRKGRRNRLERDPNFITHCNNGGAEALALDIMFGSKTILLIGFDMRAVDGKHNYHSNHIRAVPDTHYEEYYRLPFEALVRDARDLGVNIFNCTLGSALDTFPIVPLEEVLNAEGRVCA